MKIYLASQSPRRAELLQQLGLTFELVSAPINETPRSRERPREYVQRMAREKVRAGIDGVSGSDNGRGRPALVLAADTVVVVGEQILGKPTDRTDARNQLRALSGRDHLVLTAVAVRRFDQNTLAPISQSAESLSTSRVWFRDLSDDEIAWYWRTGEPADKAGSYAVQGIAGQFIRRIEGSYTGIMGLPLYESIEALRRAGAPVSSRGRTRASP